MLAGTGHVQDAGGREGDIYILIYPLGVFWNQLTSDIHASPSNTPNYCSRINWDM